MSVALLLGAPKSSSGGGKVRLMAGSWIIRIKGLIDSKLHLEVDNLRVPLEPDHRLLLCQGSEAIVTWHTRGTENHITVLAEKQQ